MIATILQKHNISTVDDLDMVMGQYGGPAFEELYEYFVGSGEMPYGVAKARTGDPGTWMYERVEPMLRDEA